MRPAHRVLLCVLDGWGLSASREANAILQAGTPALDRLREKFPFTELQTSGLAVGLPDGQMGNSEVGHTNIGAGRIVYQDLVRINRACESPGLGAIPAIRDAFDLAKRTGVSLHLMGLASPGGVHSSLEHLNALLHGARGAGLSKVFVHAFLDGRDTPPQSALEHLALVETSLRTAQVGRLATVSGRYYAMDRDQRWDRVQKAYDAMVRGIGPRAPSAEAAVKASYAEKVTDEFVVPTVLTTGNGEPVATIRDGDVVLFFNFRADRAREMCRALGLKDFTHFDRHGLNLGRLVCMTQYDETFTFPVAFGPEQPDHIFPELVSQAGWKQLRTAETEKYAHVTFFFNGGREVVFAGEDRHLEPSPRDVKTYDLKPEMSARPVTAELVKRIGSGQYDFALVNIANGDMVGHTGVWDAALKAVKVVDECVGALWAACEAAGWTMVVTADHGNIELMVDPVTGAPHTAHTLNPVPFHLCHRDYVGQKLKPGVLADIAPTLCQVMGLQKPSAMNRLGLL
ncbi:MAG: 2,3-bisphosphoglycerate-independent phosphoglycerate mutase [Myxococcaceae bacterium]|nr:2,3-bisphosphoglycerate-independent phosphoglycerate mutase [Myxococcaceae bacterium]